MRISDWSSDVCSSDLKLTLRPVPPRVDQSEAVIGLVATIGAVGHPPLARHPTSLGALADYFARLGSELMEPLGATIAEYWPQGTGAIDSPRQRTPVILRVPRDTGNGTTRTHTSDGVLASTEREQDETPYR